MFRWNKEELQSQRNRSTHAVDVAHMDAGVADGEYDYAPAKPMGFVEIDNEIMRIVWPCSINYTKSSVFTTPWELAFWDHKKRNPMICLVSVEAIVRHCLMICPALGPKVMYIMKCGKGSYGRMSFTNNFIYLVVCIHLFSYAIPASLFAL
jgi:hypothetical protein